MTGRRILAGLIAALVLPVLLSCAPITRLAGPDISRPVLGGDHFLARDGARLPLKSWLPKTGHPAAVVIALHGFNDYSNFFEAPGSWLAARGIASYAYDQRGFGAAPDHGYWPGTDALIEDLGTLGALIKARHPGVPVYLLGESMGGAVVMVAATRSPSTLAIDGIILSAPAVWGRLTMPWYQTSALWLSAHTVPGVTLTGRGLKIVASDNIEMLMALGRDPLVIKETRIDAIYGLINENFSFEAKESDNGDGGPPRGGQFILALSPDIIAGAGWDAHCELLFDRMNALDGVRMPGERRHKNRLSGAPRDINTALLEKIRDLRT